MRASAQVDRATEEPSRIMPPRMVPSSVTILSVATVSVLHVSVSTMRSGAVEQDAVAGRTLPSEEGGGWDQDAGVQRAAVRAVGLEACVLGGLTRAP
jgi:hypothetical protein